MRRSRSPRRAEPPRTSASRERQAAAERRERAAWRATGHALTWVVAAIGAACVALTAVAALLGGRPLVVESGSMEPDLPVGTVALVRPAPASSVKPGDVVAVVRADGRRILHRVIATRAAGGDAVTLVLRGDANRKADRPVTTREVEVPVVSIAGLARPVTWLGGRWTQFWLGFVAGVLVLLFAGTLRRRPAAPPGAPAAS